MKKLFAMLLAAVMAMSCGALAEWAGEFPAVTVTGMLTLDVEAAGDILAEAGVGDAQMGLWNDVLNRLNGSYDRLVIADEGVQYDLTAGDGTPMTFAAEQDGAAVKLASTLFPSYILTHGGSGAGWEDAAAASDAVLALSNQILEKIEAAVTPGIPEFGDYVVNGESFAMRIPLNIDVAAMAQAGTDLADGLGEIEALRGAGIDVHYDVPTALPAVSAWRYSADGSSVTLYTAEIAPVGAEASPISAAVRIDGEEVRVDIDAPGYGWTAALDWQPTDVGCAVRLDAAYGEWAGALDIDVEIGDETTMTTRLYVNDSEDPIATEVNTFAFGGERDYPVSGEGKTALDLEDVLSNTDGAANWLMADMMFHGFAGFAADIQ